MQKLVDNRNKIAKKRKDLFSKLYRNKKYKKRLLRYLE